MLGPCLKFEKNINIKKKYKKSEFKEILSPEKVIGSVSHMKSLTYCKGKIHYNMSLVHHMCQFIVQCVAVPIWGA